MQTVEFRFCGVKRRVKTPLGLALSIEAATGVGVMALAQQLARGDAQLSAAVTVVRLALDANGAPYSHDELLSQIEAHGSIPETMLAAAVIVNGLFYVSSTKKGKAEGNGAAVTSTATDSQ